MSNKQFEHISKIRNESQFGSDRNKKNLKNSIQKLAEDLYNNDSHFIFELVQNAEDNSYEGLEPCLSFRLTKTDLTGTPDADGALIIQNNETGFSFDNVEAICAVGTTTKSKQKGYIGEKGIGFKSVFRVTKTPYIFSNGYCFCLPEDDVETGLGYIVPKWVENPPSEIDPTQTTIILPLNKKGFGYVKVEEMLRDIEPVTILFLSKIKEIKIKTDTGDDLVIIKDDSKKPLVQILVEGEKQGEHFSDVDVDEFLLFKEPFDRPKKIKQEKREDIEERDVSVAFPIDNGHEASGKIFAYLPVRSDSGFPFLINADFILPSSREDIRDVEWNRWLIKSVAKLVAMSLPVMAGKNLLTVTLLELLAKRLNQLSKDYGSMFFPIVVSVGEAFRVEGMLPADDGSFVSAGNAKLAGGSELRKLLSQEQLCQLFQSTEKIKWLEGTITRANTRDLWDYLRKELQVEEVDAASFARRLNREFFEQQANGWFVDFYSYLLEPEFLWRAPRWEGDSGGILRAKPILRLNDGSQAAPFKSDASGGITTPNAFLPPPEETDFPIIERSIADDEQSQKFLKRLGLSEPDVFDDIVERVLPKYDKTNGLSIPDYEHATDIQKILRALNSDSDTGKKKVIQAAEKAPFLKAENQLKETAFKTPREIYLNSEELTYYFSENSNVWFLREAAGESEWLKLGVETRPRFREIQANLSDEEKSRLRGNGGHTKDLKLVDYDLDGLGLFLSKFPEISLQFEQHSLLIWNFLFEYLNDGSIYRYCQGEYVWRYYQNRSRDFEAAWIKRLKDFAWLPESGSHVLHRPKEIYLSDLSEQFERNDKLADFLGMKKDVVARLAEEAGISPDTFNLVKELENHPDLLEKIRKEIDSSKQNEEKSDMESGSAGSDDIDYTEEFKTSFNRPGKIQLSDHIADDGKVRNPSRRREKSYEEHKERSGKEPDPGKRYKETIRNLIEGPDEQVREYLLQMYGGKCQICGNTFLERSGRSFFVANYIVPRQKARFVDTPANALCLCADHFAKWQHGAVVSENILEQIETIETESEGGDGNPKLTIKLCGETCEIKLKEKHLLDLQELLRVSGSDMSGTI